MRRKWIQQLGSILLYLPLIAIVLMVAAYPILFFVVDGKVGILQRKPDELLLNPVWKLFFYMHISFGGLALLIGWVQFNAWIRRRWVYLHRRIGKLYVFSVWLSALGVLGIAVSAEGGYIAFLGFVTVTVVWFYTTTKGYSTARKQQIEAHRRWMIYSYAACTGAVTLRLWLPLLIKVTHDFEWSYQMVTWISWVPNVLVARYLVQRKCKRNASPNNL